MARISGVDLPREKRVEIGLTYIYGIGRVSSNKILAAADVNPDTRVKDLTDEEVARIRDVIDGEYTVEGDLRREVAMDIKRLQEIGCYRGIVTERAFLSADRRQRPTLEHVRVLRRQLLTRRSNLSK